MRRFALAVAVVTFVLLAACGGSASSGGGDEDSKIQLAEYEFVPSEITVAGGSSLDLVNAGIVEHTFTVADLEVDVEVAAGDEAVVTIPDKPGSYRLVCIVPGHEQQGMVGTVIVT